MAGNDLRYMTHIPTNIFWTVSCHKLALYFSRSDCVKDSLVEFNKQTDLHQDYGHVTLLKRTDIINCVKI